MNLTESARLVSERKSPILKSPIIIGTLARLSPEKDLITVIKGVEILAKQMPNQKIQLHIYGEGDLRREFEQYIYEKDLGESIFLLGKTQEPLKTISGFDLFVLASRYEGFGLVLLEALSLEIPVISSDIPTAEEVLGKTGVYFRVGEPTDLALKMSSILHGNTPSQVEQRERARKFDIKVKTAEILIAYSE
jgi:glycosyltransferase involved in cell wall biosynthesis